MYMFYMNIDNRLWGMRCKHLIYLNITNHTKKNIERILVHFQVKPKGYGKNCRQGFKLIFFADMVAVKRVLRKVFGPSVVTSHRLER
jgi:hypothetical protein